MEDHNYFYKIKNIVSEEFKHSLRQFALNSKEEDWEQKFEFNRLPLPLELFTNETFLYDVIKKFHCYKRFSIFKWEPYTAYEWHTDSPRNAAINFLLDGKNSLCLFGKKIIDEDENIKNLKVLEYTENNCFLLNTAERHSVINFDNERYIMSVCIPHPWSFNDVVDYLKSKE